MLFDTPALAERDTRVLAEIQDFRVRLRHNSITPRRWQGKLRRNLLAKAIQGSNSIEGYNVNDDDAVAAVEDDDPFDAAPKDWIEVRGYRSAMSYVLQLADDPHFALDESLLRSLHYMLLQHDLSKSPSRYRRGPIFVRDDERDETVYEGPDFELVPELMSELATTLRQSPTGNAEPPFVRAAMAHLNLVMIHPFRDGNGRMARVLQTLVLARDSIVSPEFSSIEEFLGRNTPAYYAVLAEVGAGAWHPERDALPWVRFNLRAHHIQAQTVLQRIDEARLLFRSLDDLVLTRGLPERMVDPLFDAATGLRVVRSSYERSTGVEHRTASRDLQVLSDQGLLIPVGEKRGRWYHGSAELRALHREARAGRKPVIDPYFDVEPRLPRDRRAPALHARSL
jgi:Fic family protein